MSFLNLFLLLLYVTSLVTSLPIISKPLENNSDHLVWEALLTIDTRNTDPDKTRKVPKSIFITPNLNESKVTCESGYKLGPDGRCYRTIKIDPLEMLKSQIASVFRNETMSSQYDEDYDYSEFSDPTESLTSAGQYNIPISLGFADDSRPQSAHSPSTSQFSNQYTSVDDLRNVYNVNHSKDEQKQSFRIAAIDESRTHAPASTQFGAAFQTSETTESTTATAAAASTVTAAPPAAATVPAAATASRTTAAPAASTSTRMHSVSKSTDATASTEPPTEEEPIVTDTRPSPTAAADDRDGAWTASVASSTDSHALPSSAQPREATAQLIPVTVSEPNASTSNDRTNEATTVPNLQRTSLIANESEPSFNGRNASGHDLNIETTTVSSGSNETMTTKFNNNRTTDEQADAVQSKSDESIALNAEPMAELKKNASHTETPTAPATATATTTPASTPTTAPAATSTSELFESTKLSITPTTTTPTTQPTAAAAKATDPPQIESIEPAADKEMAHERSELEKSEYLADEPIFDHTISDNKDIPNSSLFDSTTVSIEMIDVNDTSASIEIVNTDYDIVNGTQSNQTDHQPDDVDEIKSIALDQDDAISVDDESDKRNFDSHLVAESLFQGKDQIAFPNNHTLNGLNASRKANDGDADTLDGDETQSSLPSSEPTLIVILNDSTTDQAQVDYLQEEKPLTKFNYDGDEIEGVSPPNFYPTERLATGEDGERRDDDEGTRTSIDRTLPVNGFSVTTPPSSSASPFSSPNPNNNDDNEHLNIDSSIYSHLINSLRATNNQQTILLVQSGSDANDGDDADQAKFTLIDEQKLNQTELQTNFNLTEPANQTEQIIHNGKKCYLKNYVDHFYIVCT